MVSSSASLQATAGLGRAGMVIAPSVTASSTST
jgi:hypothetical protein